MMKDGEEKKIRHGLFKLPFDVVAIRIDSETPIVELRKRDGDPIAHLTDVEAVELIRQLQLALHYLPSSK